MKCFIAAFALVFFTAASASAETRTWLLVGSESAAHEAETRTARLGEVFYAEPVRYASAVRLTQNYAPHEDHPDRKVAAGTHLFRVDDERGVFFCSTLQLRDMQILDIPGVALGSAIFGGASQRGRPREILWQCFRDTNNDGAFDRVGGGAYDETPALNVIKDIRDFRRIETPVRYQSAEAPALRDGQPLYFGLRFQRLNGVSDGANHSVVLCYGLGAQAGDCNPIGSWLAGARRAPPPFEITALNGRIVIEAIEGAGAEATLRYRIERGFQPARFAIDSAAEMRTIPVQTRSAAQMSGIRSRILFRAP